MILLILCLVIFAMLSLTTVTRDNGFTTTLAEHTTAYYDAVSQAQEQVAQLDALFMQTPAVSYYSSIQQALPAGVESAYEDDVLILSFQIPIGQAQSLAVSLRVNGPDEVPRYDIISWREIQSTQWQGDNTLTLLQ
jgi:hypothetical protein